MMMMMTMTMTTTMIWHSEDFTIAHFPVVHAVFPWYLIHVLFFFFLFPLRMTMSELFDMICEKENLSSAEHQLSLPRTGARKVTFDSETAIGSLKIREVAIIRTMSTDSITGSIKVEDDSVEDLLDVQGEQVTFAIVIQFNFFQ